ncbi:MAG: HepT-like ribonuclease domain-containing protein [Myxococcota bacterium]
MSRRDDATSLRHMLDHARELTALTRGKSVGDLERDRILELAVTRLLEVIGEAARRVSEPMRAAHPEILWADIWGMRNALIHVYDDIDHGVVWRTIETDLPVLIGQLERILR